MRVLNDTDSFRVALKKKLDELPRLGRLGRRTPPRGMRDVVGVTPATSRNEFRLGLVGRSYSRERTDMKALTWHGKSDMRCESVPDPKIEHPRDAIIKVTSCAICGSDLHIFDGVIPGMEHGDVLGHETMGEVVEVGSENKKLKVGDRSSCRSPSPAASASSASAAFSRAANAPTPIARRPRSCGAIRRPACSATPTCWAAIPAARPNICACPMPMSGRSRSPTG